MVKYFYDYCGKETESTFEYLPLNIGKSNKTFVDEKSKTIKYHKYELYQDRTIHICIGCAKSIIKVQNRLSGKE